MHQPDNSLKAEKRKKLHALKERGINPFPYSFEKTSSTQALVQEYADVLKAGDKRTEKIYKIAGRLMTLRVMGKASFFNIQDQEGSLQCYIRPEELTETEKTSFDLIDLGDFVGLEGFVFKSQKGELSLHVQRLTILAKTLEPLPEKFHGVQDVEIKYRHRHLDLLTGPDARKVFLTRSKIIRFIRSFLDSRGFLEVETPTLQPLYGGAAAHPFTTHHRALDMKLYMKISPELYLKRLIVGGYEKVYEIGKNFRNEGIDRSHNPEFTMLEFYEAYTDYNYQMKQFEEIISTVAEQITGAMKIVYQGKEIDFTPPWRRLTVFEGVRQYSPIDPENSSDEEIFLFLKKKGSKLDKKAARGLMLMELFEQVAEPHLWQPTFVVDHPVECSPLTKIHRNDARLVERFEPFAGGMEIGNAYSELNDPEEQRSRLEEQQMQREHNEEAHPMDEDFLHAIETGMPPTGGVGIGIERIVMLLTDQSSIRDILFFPTMKHK